MMPEIALNGTVLIFVHCLDSVAEQAVSNAGR
jgi:hypothetical protein